PAAPAWISIATTTPPSSYGFTIQLKPRRKTGASVDSGFFARWMASSIAFSSFATSASVHADGSSAMPDIACVFAKSVPRSHTSTFSSVIATKYISPAAFAVHDHHEVTKRHERKNTRQVTDPTCI